MLDTCQLLSSTRVLDVGGPNSDGVGRVFADLAGNYILNYETQISPASAVSNNVAALPTPDDIEVANFQGRRVAFVASALAAAHITQTPAS